MGNLEPSRATAASVRIGFQIRVERARPGAGKDYVVRDGEVCHFRFNIGRA